MNISEPIPVETPKQISALDAAKIALRADGSKYAHLSPRQAALLAEHIEWLEAENIRLQNSLDFDNFADAMYVDGMADVYGEAEE